jgi:hypothetical protein
MRDANKTTQQKPGRKVLRPPVKWHSGNDVCKRTPVGARRRVGAAIAGWAMKAMWIRVRPRVASGSGVKHARAYGLGMPHGAGGAIFRVRSTLLRGWRRVQFHITGGRFVGISCALTALRIDLRWRFAMNRRGCCVLVMWDSFRAATVRESEYRKRRADSKSDDREQATRNEKQKTKTASLRARLG